MLTALAKFLAGMVIYVFIVSFSRSYPGAAGMLLTFPALNGFALALAPAEKLKKTSGIMMLLPAVNGLLCAGYMYAFAHTGGQNSAAWLLIVGASVIWFAVAFPWGRTKEGIPDSYRSIAAAMLTAVLLGATAIVLAGFVRPHLPTGSETLSHYLYQGRWRIALFAACLGGVIGVTDFLIPSERIKAETAAAILGTLGAFPVVPFFGLLTIAANDAITADARIRIFDNMERTVWLGPVVAVWYIYLLSSYLRRHASIITDDAWLKKFGLASIGWGLSVAIIVLVAISLG